MQEISNKVSLDDSQKLEVKWSPEGDTLAIAGSDQLRVVHRSNMQEIQTIPEICHENPISKL
jgi:WD40 repeat protein